MPNLKPPVVNVEQAVAYRARIMESFGDSDGFLPLMTLYLTDTTSPDDITAAVESGIVFACKLYPAGATTNSDSGVTSIDRIHGVLQRMEELQLPLCVHAEVTDSDVDIFDRERVFIDRILRPIVAAHPNLRMVVEHMTTADSVEFVKSCGENVAGTITAHHLLFNRNGER